MKLSRIQIDGFGCLQGTDLRFGPSVNLVVGPNEAGKSTLQEAILTGLYGLQSERPRGRATLVELADRWRPWQDGAFGLALEIVLDDGTRLRIERDLDAQSLRVLDLSSGDDISSRFDAEAQVGRQLVGIGRDVYANTACISRSEALRLEDTGTIKEAIASLADSAQPDRSAQRVLERLRQERLQRIGRPRSRSGPVHDLAARLAEVERQLADARRARRAVEELAQKREAVAAFTDAELSIVQTLEASVLAARLDDARRRLERVQQIDLLIREEEARQKELERFASFARERHEEVQGLRSHLRATREAQRDFDGRAAAVAEQVQDLEAERARLETEAREQEARARGIDELALKEEPLVRELTSSLTFADAQAPEVHLRAHVCAQEVRRIAERHPGMIGPGLDWAARRVEFQRGLAEWRERSTAAAEARTRAGTQLPPRLQQLKQDIGRYREVPEVIKAGQQTEEAMRQQEAMAERARARQRTSVGAMLGGLLLTAVAVLVVFLAFSGGLPNPYIPAGIGLFLLGMGVLAAIIGIIVRSRAIREVDWRLKAKDEARVKRREILGPWGVRSSGELQQALVEHLQKVRSDATRLELDRQALELEERGETAGRALRELAGSWGLAQPAPTDEAVQETAGLVDSLAEDAAAWNAALQRSQEASRAEALLDERREGLRQRLHSVLERIGFDRQEAVAAGREFIAASEAARAAQQLRTRIDQLDAQLQQLRQPAERARAEAESAAEYDRQLAAIYGAAGIVETDSEAAARAWDEAVAGTDAYRASRVRFDDLRQQRQAVAAEPQTQALEGLVADLSVQLDQAVHGIDPQRVSEYRTAPLAELERQRDQHRAAKERAQEERARSEELLNDRLMQIGDVAALEEAITSLREQLHQLEADGHAYDLAIETLEAAARSVRRAVIPRLKAQLQRQLIPITNGRYREVKVSDDLGLQVKAQDQRVFKDVDDLSLGTRSLIYLLQRLALAGIISGSTEPLPLLLDEALVHADRRRMRAALEELGRLGQEHQIVLFSKDEALAERGERVAGWTVIRLPGPPQSASVEAAVGSAGERAEAGAI